MATTPQIPDQGHILRMPNFRIIWLAQFVSIFGDFLALFGIISFITFRLHGSPIQVTTVTVAYILPLAIFGPPTGVLVDHFDSRKTMIASDLIRGALILLLLVVHDVRQIAAVMFAISVVSCFFMPSQSVTVRTIVPKDRLLHATAALSQAFYIIRIASPLVAGAIVAAFSERATFIIDAVSFGLSALLISRLNFSRPPREGADKSLRGLTRDFVEGNRFIFTHPGLSFVFIAMAVAMFVLSSFSPLISIFVRDQLHAGAMLFGIISGMVGVGLILGTSLITRIVGKRPQPSVVLVGLLITGVATSVLGVSYYGWEAAVSMFILGFAVSLVLIPAQTMSQQETPVEMAGRVSSTFMSMISIAQILGLLVSGTLAEKLGIRQLFFSCTAFLIVIATAGWIYLRSRVPAPSVPATE
jgi:DHA3 family macrolide efflux protein-like MFS transporter